MQSENQKIGKTQKKCCKTCLHWATKYSLSKEGWCHRHSLSSYSADLCRKWEEKHDEDQARF